MIHTALTAPCPRKYSCVVAVNVLIFFCFLPLFNQPAYLHNDGHRICCWSFCWLPSLPCSRLSVEAAFWAHWEKRGSCLHWRPCWKPKWTVAMTRRLITDRFWVGWWRRGRGDAAKALIFKKKKGKKKNCGGTQGENCSLIGLKKKKKKKVPPSVDPPFHPLLSNVHTQTHTNTHSCTQSHVQLHTAE